MKKRSILMPAILLGSILLLVQGCAPTIKIAPVKPSIAESDFDLALKNVDLVYESVPGEVLKYDVYFSVRDFNIKGLVGARPSEIEQIKKEIEKLKKSWSFSGECEMTTEGVSLSKDVSSKSLIKFKSGELSGMEKTSHQVISNKGKILYSDSNELQGLWGTGSPQSFPDYPVGAGNQWRIGIIELNDKEFGKIRFSGERKLVGFKLIEGRPCAKIITELKSEPVWIKGGGRVNFNAIDTSYHDLGICQLFYNDTIISMNFEFVGADVPAELKGASATMEMVSTGKLNYQNSIFKRPVNASPPSQPVPLKRTTPTGFGVPKISNLHFVPPEIKMSESTLIVFDYYDDDGDMDRIHVVITYPSQPQRGENDRGEWKMKWAGRSSGTARYGLPPGYFTAMGIYRFTIQLIDKNGNKSNSLEADVNVTGY